MPSPTMPTGPCCAQLFNGMELVAGQEFGAHVVHARLPGNGVCGVGVVTGQHDGRYAHAPEFPQGGNACSL